MNITRFLISIPTSLLIAFSPLTAQALDAPPSPSPQIAPTPPLGWNSYDAYGTSITESELLANAHAMQQKLLPHGWNILVVDARWYDSVSSYDDRDFNRERANAKLFADNFGRLLPAPNRFPSATGDKGFKPLADQLHAMGLKFGVHLMRGIPRQAVLAKTPIEGSTFTAADAGNPNNKCSWCPDMFGVRNNPAGQAWYDSLFRLLAAWGLDYVKIDDLSRPYSTHEIEMIRHAIDKCGRPILFSTSPGPTDIKQAGHISQYANMWRISGDFWDRWKDLNHQFDLLADWQSTGGPNHWPDADMIPLGHIGIKCTIAGPDRHSRFTPDEQRTLMTLWSIAPSPMMLGADLTDLDAPTLALLTNDEVLAINQDPLGAKAKRIAQNNKTEIWQKPLQNGDTALALFNRGDTETPITLDWKTANLPTPHTLRDPWSHKILPTDNPIFTATLPPHGSLLLRLIPAP